MENEGLLDQYRAKLAGEEKYDGKACYVIELKAKRKDTSYASQKVWVDKAKYIGLKVEMYASDGMLLKELLVLKVEKIGGHNFGTHIMMSDKKKKNSSTEFKMTNVKIDVKLPAGAFSLRMLNQ